MCVHIIHKYVLLNVHRIRPEQFLIELSRAVLFRFVESNGVHNETQQQQPKISYILTWFLFSTKRNSNAVTLFTIATTAYVANERNKYLNRFKTEKKRLFFFILFEAKPCDIIYCTEWGTKKNVCKLQLRRRDEIKIDLKFLSTRFNDWHQSVCVFLIRISSFFLWHIYVPFVHQKRSMEINCDQ